MKKLESAVKRHGLKLIFDAAHAFGSAYKGTRAGRFGDAEVFSLSPTKLLITGEGGLVATNDKVLADMVKVGRNYGDSGDYDCAFNGFNARMPEFNAILGINGIRIIDKKISRRNRIAMLYTDFFKDYEGISFQEVEEGNLSTFKDYSIIVDPGKVGIDRDILAFALDKENIMTRKYFYPPVHMQKAYRLYKRDGLEVTERLSARVLSLPIYCSLSDSQIEKICYAFARILKYKNEIKEAFEDGKRHKEHKGIP
jgi:dTDP-4-amino-4,6-dideoxygalactose transaminase